jgi:hypothetical protein
MTPERKAELWAKFDREWGPRKPRPKVVVRDDVVRRDADVHVSRGDPNAAGTARQVPVRAPDPGFLDIGVETNIRGDVVAYGTTVNGEPRWVELGRDTRVAECEYDPFSKDRMRP